MKGTELSIPTVDISIILAVKIISTIWLKTNLDRTLTYYNSSNNKILKDCTLQIYYSFNQE